MSFGINETEKRVRKEAPKPDSVPPSPGFKPFIANRLSLSKSSFGSQIASIILQALDLVYNFAESCVKLNVGRAWAIDSGPIMFWVTKYPKR